MTKLRFGPTTFSIIFCCAYAAVFALDWPIFLYYPMNGQFQWGREVVSGAGPAMAWYGLMASAAIIALVAAIALPERLLANAFRNHVWLLAIATMLVCVFLLRALFIY